jgi:hypothetical protein
MSNPEIFQYHHDATAMWAAGFLALGMLIAFTGALTTGSRGHRRGANIAVGVGAVVFCLALFALIAVVIDASADLLDHQTAVSEWLFHEYDVDVAQEDLDSLLRYETIIANVDGENRHISLTEDHGDLVLMLDDRD